MATLEHMSSLTLTIPICRRHCVSYNYGLAVLQGDTCSCLEDDSSLLPYSGTSDSDCNSACSGDKYTKCGGAKYGDLFMSVYEAYGKLIVV